MAAKSGLERSWKFRQDHPGYSAAKSKAWRQKNPEKAYRALRNWYINNKEKKRANLRVQNAVRSGKLTRMPCSECGEPKTHAHHADYSKPLDVIWLCQKHHHMKHRKQLPG